MAPAEGIKVTAETVAGRWPLLASDGQRLEYHVWAFLEIVMIVLEMIPFLPRNPRADTRPAAPVPNWVRWPIYGVIVLAVFLLIVAWIIILVV